MGRVMAEDAFEAVVGAHHAEIRRYLLRLTARASDADDLSQETFLRAFRAYRALPPGANVRAWLFTIATNLGRNHFRAQSRRRRAYAAVALDAPTGAPDRTDGRVLADEARVRVEQVIGGLPEKQRLAFARILLQKPGVTVRDVATLLGNTETLSGLTMLLGCPNIRSASPRSCRKLLMTSQGLELLQFMAAGSYSSS